MLNQWRTEVTHVANIIGGASSQEKYGSQPGPRQRFINQRVELLV